MKKFSDIVLKESVIKYLNEVEGKPLLVYSPTSAEKIKLFDNLKNNIRSVSTHETYKEIKKIDEYLNNNKDIDCIIGFGGGTAIDIAKYMAHKMNLKMVAIPSMLSTNVYSTDKVLMSNNGIKSTMDSKMPDLIVYDEEILKLSLTENLFGFADVLTIYTASKDWQIACKNNGEKLDEEIFAMDIELLNNTINYILNTDYENIKSGLFEMFNFIGTVGHITNLYGSGRPVSGSEHIFAKELEHRITVPHGISVATGILIMSLHQSNYSTDVEKCFEKLKIFDYAEKYNVDKKIIYEVLDELEPRVDRFTVVNLFNKKDITINNRIEEILNKFNLK